MGPADGLLVVGTDGCIWVYNRPAEELLGLPAGCLSVGASLRQVVPLPALLAAVEARLQGAAAVREQVIEIGPQQTIYADVAPLPAGDGGSDSVLVLLRDTREIERLQSMRRDFIANVSHEMRTPLAAIRGCSATLLAGALSDRERARHFVEVIEQHAVRLGHLLDDLACLADLEHGRVELHRRPLAVAPAVESAVSVCRDQALAAGIALESSVASDTPLLDGDRDLLDQVLVRLIDNALRYTPRGGRVRLSAAPTAAPGGDTGPWVRLAVVDTGVGIPAQDVPRLSERFYRPDKGRSRELGGSGLGLALVKHIVRAHGGVMEIASALNQGTTVALFWPSCRAAADTVAAQAGER